MVAAVTAPLTVSATKYTVDVESALFQSTVAPDGVTSVYVQEGLARIRGPATDVTLHATESWSSDTGAGHDGIAQRDAAAARALAAAAEQEAVLRISKPVGAQISLDGVELGLAPLEVVAKLGAHEITAVHRGVKSTAKATVAARGGELELPEAPPPPLPDVSFEPAVPEPVPEAHPKRVEPPADPGKRYLLARSLAQKGRYTEALGIYEGLANGTSGWAEPSQYEVARLALRALKNPGRARTELDDYRRRWPNGSLAHEVGLSAIEVRLKLGDGQAALKEIDDFLIRFPTSERQGEVRKLRAELERFFEGAEQ
jgi:tetratricopeptide (TPR) repeat protein